ncbi:MAG: hypothetical protein JHC30_06650 [Caldisericum sp.]|nr:hypothetical protein [Caldisericum sp.]
MIQFVQKRDGRVVPFEKEKITKAIEKAGLAAHEFGRETAEYLTNIVVQEIIFEKEPVNIEIIQNKIEEVLMRKGFYQTAKAFIIYREKRRELRELRKHLNIPELFDAYIGEETWEVHENANIDYSIQGLKAYITGKAEEIYWLEKVYPKKISDYHKDGFVHIHNLSFLGAYCVGWDLEDLIKRGFGGVPGKPYSSPAKHLSSILGQMMNFLFTLQNEAAGAVAFSSFDTLLAPFVYFDKLSYKEVKQQIQEFIYNMNQTMRTGGQSPFSNITVDLTPHPLLKDKPVIIGGKPIKEYTYGMFKKEMDLINKALFEVYIEGDGNMRPHTFPIPTLNISKDFDWDNPVLEPVWEATAKYGTPYFCLEEKTKIITKNGIKEIKDIETGDEVLSDNGNFAKVTHVEKIVSKENIVIEGDNFNIICSPNHRFPTDNGIKRADELSLRDRLLLYKEKIILENGMVIDHRTRQFFELEDISSLTKKEFVKLTPKRIIKEIPPFKFNGNRWQTTLNNDIKIPEDLNEDIMELFGIVIGDGSIQEKSPSIRVVNADEEIIDFVTKTFEKEFNVKPYIRQAGRSKVCKDMSINSRIVVDFFKYYGISGSTHTKRIPEALFFRNEKEIGALLRGLFDTDGSIHINNNEQPIISISFSNEKLMKDTILLLAKIGIVGKFNRNKDNEKGRIVITGKRNIEIFKKKVGFRIKRKAEKLDYETKIDRPSIGDKIVSKEEGAKFSEAYKRNPEYKNAKWVRIISDNEEPYLFIEKIEKGIEKVKINKISYDYTEHNLVDITVDSPNHLFVLENGIISHNSNYINSDLRPEDARSMCCRLRLETRELKSKGGGLFGANPLTGSTGVITINMPRIGYLAKSEEEFFSILDDIMDAAKEGLEKKRETVEKFTEMGLYPYSRIYLDSIKESTGHYWSNHFSTIGLIGMNEALMNFFGINVHMGTQKGIEFAVKVLEHMRNRLRKYQEETDHLFNLEATPAESTAYSLALKDKKLYPDIITAGTEENPYYTNSTQLPVGFTDDPFEVAALQEPVQKLYTGGCIEKGNKVLTDKGLLPIEYIVENFSHLKPIKALSYNKDRNISEWDEIVEAVKIDVSKENKIRVKGEKGLDIVTSDWHPFFVLEEIKPDTKCPVCGTKVNGIKGFAAHLRHNPTCREKYISMDKFRVVEKRADELKVGDYILQNSFNMYPDKESELDENLMWLIGFFIGDGSISKSIDNRGGNHLEKYYIRFFSESQRGLEKAASILNNNFGCNINVTKSDKRSDALREVVTSKKDVIDFFFKYGFWAGEKVYDIYVPEKVKENITQKNVYAFISGLIDSHGTIGKRDGDLEYDTVSERLANDILEIFTKAGILATKALKKTKRENEKDIFRIRVPQYELTRIKEKLGIEANLDRVRNNFSDRVRRQLPVVRVKEISKVDVEDNEFYDLMTKNNHNYLAGKNCLVFVHNTVVHFFLGERLTNPNSAKIFVRKILENFEIPYITLTPSFSICPKHGYIPGEHEFCPYCDEELKEKARKGELESNKKSGKIDIDLKIDI